MKDDLPRCCCISAGGRARRGGSPVSFLSAQTDGGATRLSRRLLFSSCAPPSPHCVRLPEHCPQHEGQEGCLPAQSTERPRCTLWHSACQTGPWKALLSLALCFPRGPGASSALSCSPDSVESQTHLVSLLPWTRNPPFLQEFSGSFYWGIVFTEQDVRVMGTQATGLFCSLGSKLTLREDG